MSTIKICRKHLPKVDFSSIVHQLPDSTTMTKSWLFFADGARSNNGRGGARAGVGVAGGEGEDFHASKSFSDLVLDGGITKRTSQIAELRAAMVAVSSIDDFYGEFEGNEEPAPKKPRRSLKHGMDEPIDNTAICIIAMDSEVVNQPISAYSYLLEENICKVEKKWGIQISFWWVPRRCNMIADELAKDAAKLDTGEN
ncbi:hypothetical protein TWF569_011944 [Orbilia oligospora]|uniref:RNase H type-1 domain-containing protein n=1 Tax=Orbilia oligospora TaxID=2813651 RepID=A0A7C8J0Z9_ORBOL|nr:hypothetical protein TWF102_003298 [Orbilia oligospora]KAF3112398.1 hypothetical protein TWF103_003182 [Orbilia oligospora]KAF3119862.1 hypothetical protein TWF703_003004 [Orbilia oligospora]KAF3123112.1 hypothetical protein TWF594_002523 [Orbilia oligospora]KAF3126935.1 hypothetical protein TWF569_011944 [Orbilia oligospora]